jgi:TatD DNase family protein
VRAMVANGTRPKDWPTVAELAKKYKWVVPSYGLHPWYVNQVCENWREILEECLQDSWAAIGEIGLDRWIEGFDSAKQEEVFIWQLELAKRLERPVTIHCLRSWGRMLELLEKHRLRCGFLLHSYGGPAEMVKRFVELGGYFSTSGYYAHERKEKQREVFRAVPLERILVETDAPDMLLPEKLREFDLGEVNHPGNIVKVYSFAAELLGIGLEEFAEQVENNFKKFYKPVLL